METVCQRPRYLRLDYVLDLDLLEVYKMTDKTQKPDDLVVSLAKKISIILGAKKNDIPLIEYTEIWK